MKKKIFTAIAVVLCLGMTGCGKQVATGDTTETATSEAVETTQETETSEEASSTLPIDTGDSAEYTVNIDMQEATEERKDENGVILLKLSQSFPDVTIDGSAAAADNMNDFYTKEKETFFQTADEYEKNAAEDYATREEEQQKDWRGYDLSTEHMVERADDQCISIVNLTCEDLGGAHPNAFQTAATFDTASGEQLTFDTIFTDVDAAKKFVTDYLLSEMKDEKYKDCFFDDYEKDVPSILQEDTWYLSKEGFVIICNEYIVSPHAAGIIEFTIPYADFKELSDTYKPAAN